MNSVYQVTKQVIDFRRNQFLNKGLQTEFTIQQENKNRLISVGTQLKNLNTTEANRRVDEEISENSSGESSVCEFNMKQRRLSVEDVQRMIIDTQREEMVEVEARPSQKNSRIDEEWEGVKNLIVVSVEERTGDKVFIQFRKFEYVVYGGKLSLLVKTKDDRAAQYVYFNMKNATYKYKKFLGENYQVFIVNMIFEKSDEVVVCLRYLPLNFCKEKLDSIQNVRCEELFEYQGYKYGIAKSKMNESAEQLRKHIQNYLDQKGYFEHRISIIDRKKNNGRFDQFQEECVNAREIMEQKMGIMKQMEEPIVKQMVKQMEPILKPIQLELSKIVRPVMLKPVQLERQRSSRKR